MREHDMEKNDLQEPLLTFSHQLFLESYKASKNAVVSPLSVAVALLILMQGAKGKTYEELIEVLNINKSNEKNLFEYMTSLQDEEVIKLNIANSLWIKKDFDLDRSFVRTIKDNYNVKTDVITTAEQVNKWITNATKGTINKMVESLHPDTILLLLNAIHFQAKWKEPFSESLTFDDDFITEEGIVTTTFMVCRASYHFQTNTNYDVLRLEYENDRFVMDIIVPSKGVRKEEVMKELKTKNDLWDISEEKKIGIVEIPKFTLETELELPPILNKMGIKEAFIPDKADFSPMIEGDERLYIDECKHKTFLEVDETGTEAGAATSIEVRSSQQEVEFHLKVDRPFLLQLKDIRKQIILFYGSYESPN
ncbi:serpin family protein [Evansella cellulosilytica]|uniref:Proteinase inhibitor I4 serpin n=1 Tax=Evansella cellulosilytica (strain ATCC 21833 / DSM 2522 / FERM P-1141 / JCM 9156 / N-4) TaxID=649639 RepID=E6U2B9_EVAC2|nr:serpin family protein [Evansella cellulosilytica]ADU31632.1 proteinase inhibitor I4 serpin [Evansella cellulosilytica DSM 2522]